MTRSWVRSKPAAWTLTGLLLVCAWGVSKATLPDEAAIAPFRTVAEQDRLATTRDLAVTVTDVRAAQKVADAEGWSAEGTWLVVDLEVAAVQSQDARLGLSELVVGKRTFSATDRGVTLHRTMLIPGVPRAGALAFELPADALHGRATLRLGTPTGPRGDAALDGVIELELDLDEVPVEREIALPEIGWAR